MGGNLDQFDEHSVIEVSDLINDLAVINDKRWKIKDEGVEYEYVKMR